ncbi:hypothetical protein LCGC14_2158330, partial [marine sediment metagenome]
EYIEQLQAELDELREELSAETGRANRLHKYKNMREAEIEQLQAELDKYKEALEKIVSWSKAYPIEVFPEPDLKRVAVILKVHGITLDAVSASAMRHVIKSVGEIAEQALKGR